MAKQDTENDNGNSFEYRLKEVSDQEIISILRFREHFQPQAVKDAVKEALKRGIINSVDDLNKPEFQPQSIQPRSMFPVGINRNYTFAIFKSLCRIFYIFGLIPVLFGVFQFISHNYIPAIVAVLAGAGFIAIAHRIEKKIEPFWANVILFMNIPVVLMAFLFINNKTNVHNMDIFSIIIVVLVFLYTSIYLKKLTTNLHSESH